MSTRHRSWLNTRQASAHTRHRCAQRKRPRRPESATHGRTVALPPERDSISRGTIGSATGEHRRSEHHNLAPADPVGTNRSDVVKETSWSARTGPTPLESGATGKSRKHGNANPFEYTQLLW